MKLIIVESPSKSKTIQKYLGEGFKVMASGGHICDLPEKSLGIDINDNFKPEYVVNENKKNIIKKLKEAAKNSEEIYLATDPDREGEAISWHLANVLELDSPKRIEFNEISKKAVNAALNAPREINIRLVNSQQARRVLDRLVGYKISPVLNKKIKSGLSGGRVQSAALKMIVDREREIRAFVPEEYWNIFALLTKKGQKDIIKAALNDYNGKKIKVTTAAQAKAIEDNIKGASWKVDSVKKGVSKSRPSPPFTTSTLQQDASHRLGISAPEVMRIAQQLYEGVDIEGEGHTALVTYIRTDSVRISSGAQQEALSYIKEVYGKDYVPARPNVYAKKSANVQDAHEAIRPISLQLTPEKLKSKISRNHYRLYKLIYDRYLASQMTDAVYNTLNAHITAFADSGNYGFKVTGKTLVFKGYTVVYDNQSEEGEEKCDTLPLIEEGEEPQFKELICEQKFTKPPSRYTEATLVKAMEENGIGRPSTYATVISVLAKRDYTVKEKKTLKPTQLGETVVEFMENNFTDIVDIKFTAGMEDKLDAIAQGEEWQKIIADFYPPFEKNVKMAYSKEKKIKLDEETTDVVCEKCGALMVIRSGRYGKFMACPNYPKCKNVKSFVEKVGKCPKCGGDIVKKKTKKGKLFYGCGNYPQCDFLSWELPAPYYCPQCSNVMTITQKGDNKVYVCLNKNCKHSIIAKNEED
ncbi:MAG: type I DNA topoisomerase [Christensenellales bacterium]|jgi:DNA topoisomerase-1